MMHTAPEDRFVRIPNPLFDALLQARLTGAQWRLLLWVIRHTCGWNRRWTAFSWYRVAKELNLDRAAAYRAGQALLRAGVLLLFEEQMGLQSDPEAWGSDVLSSKVGRNRQLWMAGLDVVRQQRKPLSACNGTVVSEQRFRCQETTIFRRAKNSSKDRLKTYKDKRKRDDGGQRFQNGAFSEQHYPAGAARPVPGKYDGLS